MKIALGIEYDGNGYCGWQFQEHSPSVQACVEKALSQVANHPVRVICAGRTDTGVHALGQVIHFETEANRSLETWILGSNANLPKNIVVTWAKQVDDKFHARFSAKKRRYRYVIFNRGIRPTFLAYRVAWEYRKLDADLMNQAAKSLIGEHDFNAYRASSCQAKTSVRNMYNMQVFRDNDLVIIELQANAFLHHMVRNIAGVLMSIGAGEQPVQWAQHILDSKDRTKGGVTAPPYGLYLIDVDYAPNFDLPLVENTKLAW